jgi:hypothetical protein
MKGTKSSWVPMNPDSSCLFSFIFVVFTDGGDVKNLHQALLVDELCLGGR